MRLYLDDDIIDRVFVKLLRRDEFDIELPADCQMTGAADANHLTRAIQSDRVIMSFNHDDFERLHHLIVAAEGHHPGILIVRKDNDKRDLTPTGIVAALKKFISFELPVANQFIILNQFR
jgi:hypothetical protein